MTHKHKHGHHHDSAHKSADGHDHLGNPTQLADYLQRLEGADRAEWQKPDALIAALSLRPTDHIAEIGAGPGYISLRLARAAAHVFAVEAEPRMLEVLRDRISAAGAANVTPVLALQDDPLLPPASCDLVLIVNTFHHFPDGAAYLRRVRRSLKPGGRIANVDFHDRETPVGPPLEHRLSRDAFLEIAQEAGLGLAAEHRFLQYQYFLVLKPQ